MNPTVLRILRALPFLMASLACGAQTGPQKLPAIVLHAGMHNIQAEVARTPDQRATGLMFRETMPANDGMLFAFEDANTQCFWMKNTFVPLSAAFIGDDGSIVNIVDMRPQALDSHCSAKPVRYVLEMNQGWFAKRGIKAGFRLTGEPFQR
ncbi:MAG TPA: DUF192 domain-containing protein [Albitalea sp.]|uniref:DUF192 domain-containing protein n=1 Tax=Piscinibacter sp. TaxID=1903157 RepID=UPI002EFA1C44